MQKKNFSIGETIYEIGKPLEGFTLILDGKLWLSFAGGGMELKRGDVAGISAIYQDCHMMSSSAILPITAAVYECKSRELLGFLQENEELRIRISTSASAQIRELFALYKQRKGECFELYRSYVKFCTAYTKMCETHGVSPRTLPAQEGIAALSLEGDIEPWLFGYYRALSEMIIREEENNKLSADFYCGTLMAMSRSISELISLLTQMHEYKETILNVLMNTNQLDLFDLFTSTYLRVFSLAQGDKPDDGLIREMIKLLEKYGVTEGMAQKKRITEFDEKLNSVDQIGADQDSETADPGVIRGSLAQILEYAGCEVEKTDVFEQELLFYRATVNKSSTEDADRKRRLVLSKHFYEIYQAAVMKSLDDENVPRIVKMFLHFGYVDEELAGMENAAYLYNIVEHLPTDPTQGVYTFYEWLQAIFTGLKEPSRNEFDSDYNDYVSEMRRNNKIDKFQEQEMMEDTREKVKFELNNVFPSINKVTNGRITTFCPLFSEHNVLRPLKQMLVTADIVKESIGEIRAIDFGAFCRESIFTQPESGVPKEMINQEVLPDVILTPNVGSRGIMWQEIEGKRRSTPSRFMVSLFQADDLKKILRRLVGEFRWEMCKRIQGARWNDASERSLTSDFSDYVATYRKNNDLSSDVKEKIKSDLGKVKNNTKELFLLDYQSWLLYESNGSPRLNKVSRMILFTYCPFTKAIREKLKSNPFYTEYLDKYDIRLRGRIRHMDNLGKSIKSKGHEIPKEIVETRRILEM
ncbi:MAG: hypothetical protein LBC96_07955 [Lachnospiraceae bacterium]|jgi:hypothetical protein|nr:hypothetical protein [Lachnospiraceae bacterium]